MDRGGTKNNHLMFANDCVIFSRAKHEKWAKIHSILCNLQI